MADDFKPDFSVVTGSKMLQALFVSLGVKPNVEGVLRAVKADPEIVAAFIEEVQRQGPAVLAMLDRLSQAFPSLGAALQEHVDRTRRCELMLEALCKAQGVEPPPQVEIVTPFQEALRIAQEPRP